MKAVMIKIQYIGEEHEDVITFCHMIPLDEIKRMSERSVHYRIGDRAVRAWRAVNKAMEEADHARYKESGRDEGINRSLLTVPAKDYTPR